jgi:hypothetical protein
MQSFCEINDKGEEVVQRYEINAQGRVRDGLRGSY